MDTTLLATENGIKNQNQTNLDKMSNLIILNDGTILDNKYEIIREIARGGMGIVYEAYNIHNYKTVAIKMILSNNIESPQLKRFQKEIEAYSLLSHPNVIRIYDSGIYNNYPYIVMEYIKGVDICTYVKQHNATDWKLCARLIYETALGLEYIHSQKMIHRDIKPSNIIVRPNGSPVIIDLGVVKFNRSQSYNLTQSKEVIGTIEYMPIEQAQGKNGQIDVRTDVYSLGLVLYELLTGQRAYSGENLMELCYKIMCYNPPLPRKINPKIPEVLEEITLHAIEKQQEKRYSSMKKFSNALKEYLSGTKVKSISHYDEWIEKRERVFSTWIAVLLAIILVIVVSMLVIIVNPTIIKISIQQENQKKPKKLENIKSKQKLVNKNNKNDNFTTKIKNFRLDSENNKSQNYELLLELANQGDAEAQYQLGLIHYEKQDYAKARECFEELVSQGNVKAQFYLGLMRYNGYGVAKDLDIAFNCFVNSANQGNSEAQFYLGLMYEKGYGVEKDLDIAFNYFVNSANQGNSEAQLKLGDMYIKSRNIQQAIDWLNKVKESNNQQFSQKATEILESIEKPILEYIEKLQNYEKIANQGDAQIQFNLGLMYYNGYNDIAKDILGITYYRNYEGIAKDLKKAIHWLEKAANQENAEAQYKLGMIHFRGDGVTVDIEEAIHWLKKSANQKNAEAQLTLGDIYYNGQVITQNLKKAFDWYQKAAKQGNKYAQRRLGDMYYNGQGVAKNWGMAKYWYEKANSPHINRVIHYNKKNIRK